MGAIGSVITALARHRVSANVLMVVFILAGAWATTKLGTRFFPPFETNVISVSVNHQGIAPAEIEESVLVPLENGLRNVKDQETMYSYARDGSGSVVLEFPDGTDIDRALNEVKDEVEKVALPTEADAPRTVLHARDEDVAVLTIATDNRSELRDLARRIENDFNAQGIAKIEPEGIPEEEILIYIDQERLIELGLTIEQVGEAIRLHNYDTSVGSLRGLGNIRQVRAQAKSSDFNSLYNIPISNPATGEITYLRDIARIERDIADDQVEIRYNGRPAVQFQITSTGNRDLLGTADEVYEWIERIRPQFPQSVDLILHDEDWRAVDSRLTLLVENGISGMLIVVAMLYIFLSSQVAFWVAAGIPVAMLGTLFVFSLTGGTINMISMFALIMAVGIIVDDAIVVGENAQHRRNRGEPPMRAVTSAARTMFPPVFASSFTTIASFMPLFLVGGVMGSIIFDIPMIIICILIAALVECFCILPGHLYHSFAKRSLAKPNKFRSLVDAGFKSFRENHFRRVVRFAVRHRPATIAMCFVLLALSVSLISNGYVNYRFFPGAERSKLTGSVEFNVGTPREKMEDYVWHMAQVLDKVASEAGAGRPLIEHVSVMYGAGSGRFSAAADYRAKIDVELVDPDARDITTQQLSGKWRRALGNPPPGVEKLSMRGERGGPPGNEVEVRLTGPDIETLKLASLEIQEAAMQIPGVLSTEDDTPFGEDEYLFELTALGRSLDLKVSDISRQLRHAIAGFSVQTFTEGVDETDLKVLYANFGDNVLEQTYIRLPNGEFAVLSDIVSWQQGTGFEVIQRQEGEAAISVSAELESEGVSVGDVIDTLEEKTLTGIRDSLGVDYSFEGRQHDQRETVNDMMIGLALALVLIFIILTWVFNSWSLPLVVMVTMPLGVIGTVFGHWAMGLTMSILSFFGMFTLMGIIVNNSIVLVRCFQDLGPDIDDASSYDNAIVDASCLRLRAVMLTSLTTIGGLTPLMFETSLQAQFLIPMAASIVFGLAFAAVLILLFTPACLSVHGAIQRKLRHLTGKGTSRPYAAQPKPPHYAAHKGRMAS